MDECDVDPDDDNFPYREATFRTVRRLSRIMLHVSSTLGVSPLAVAGSIAAWHGRHAWLDPHVDHFLRENLSESIFEWSVRWGSSSKFLNATRHDIGDGNINIATAREVYDEFRQCFVDDPVDTMAFVDEDRARWRELVDFVLTDEGTVVVAALVIEKGMAELASYLAGQPPELQEALLVTYPGKMSRLPSARGVPGVARYHVD